MNSATTRTIDRDEDHEIPPAQSTSDAERSAGIDRDRSQPITSSQVRPTGGTPGGARSDVNIPTAESRAKASRNNNPEETNIPEDLARQELRNRDPS